MLSAAEHLTPSQSQRLRCFVAPLLSMTKKPSRVFASFASSRFADRPVTALALTSYHSESENADREG